MGNVMSHLTNYSLNKRSDKYDKADEEGTEGTKRYLSTTVAQLPPEAADPFWERVDNIVACTMAAIQPPLADAYRRAFGDTERSRCFQILGFDVMLDKDGMPHLLEVNSHPASSSTASSRGQTVSVWIFLGHTATRYALWM